VEKTLVGYTGGALFEPTYKRIGDHTEAILVEFTDELTFEDILKKFCMFVALVLAIYGLNLLAIESAGALGLAGLPVGSESTHTTESDSSASTHGAAVEEHHTASTAEEVSSESSHGEAQTVEEIEHPDIQFVLCGHLTRTQPCSMSMTTSSHAR